MAGYPFVQLSNSTYNVGVSSSAAALAADANRIYGLFMNDGDIPMYLKFGSSAVAHTGIRLGPNGGAFEMSPRFGNLDLRAVFAVATASGKLLLITVAS